MLALEVPLGLVLLPALEPASEVHVQWVFVPVPAGEVDLRALGVERESRGGQELDQSEHGAIS